MDLIIKVVEGERSYFGELQLREMVLSSEELLKKLFLRKRPLLPHFPLSWA